MLKKLMAGTGREYVSLDNLETRKDARGDPERFLAKYQPPLLVDEIQYAPELFSYIKIAVDNEPTPGSYWLIGSQMFKLMRGVRESLAGRAAILQLSSLSQSERWQVTGHGMSFTEEGFRSTQTERSSLPAIDVYDQLITGSMPAIASGQHENLRIFYNSYVDTYLERDLRDITPGIDTLRFMDFLHSAAARVSQTLNYASMARDAAISEKTARAWLDILETMGIVFLLHPFSNNALTRTIKSPKLYFFDTGLVCHLASINDKATLERDSLAGAIFENYVVSELTKSYLNQAIRPPLYYYRDTTQKEIDLIIEENRELHPFEIKLSANPSIQKTKAFKALAATDRLSSGGIICTASKLQAYNLDNIMLPYYLI